MRGGARRQSIVFFSFNYYFIIFARIFHSLFWVSLALFFFFFFFIYIRVWVPRVTEHPVRRRHRGFVAARAAHHTKMCTCGIIYRCIHVCMCMCMHASVYRNVWMFNGGHVAWQRVRYRALLVQGPLVHIYKRTVRARSISTSTVIIFFFHRSSPSVVRFDSLAFFHHHFSALTLSTGERM